MLLVQLTPSFFTTSAISGVDDIPVVRLIFVIPVKAGIYAVTL